MANGLGKIYNLVVLQIELLEVHEAAELGGDVTQLIVSQKQVLELQNLVSTEDKN